MNKCLIEISTDQPPTASELLNLFRQTSWANNRNEKDVALLLKDMEIFVVIRMKGSVIGFGRALTDGVYRAMLDDIIVAADQRANGVGSLIVKHLLQQLKGVEQIFLNTKPELEAFYAGFGFSKSTCFTMNT